MGLSACDEHELDKGDQPLATLKQQLAQKIMLDFRYYCHDEIAFDGDKASVCTQPMTELPEEIAQLIAGTDLGGVILFSDNLVSVEQIVTLNHQLAVAGQNAALKLPLFIAVDQEGGRVARLPRNHSTAFTGSMSIAATYAKHGVKYARLSGEIIGQELMATGFNLNFAPTVDVNVNPDNPVINVRSFGEDADQVAELATAQLKAMQSQQVLGTLKHFPGHGDTSVDSHTGLPLVAHNVSKIKQVDLAPFQYAIEQNVAHAIMTAHIQYPALDSSTFVSKDGKTMIKPATMSKAILTDLLREKMNFQGLVITDALDMKGISEFFDETQAVIETFNAGADIALMPIAIRSKGDIVKFEQLLSSLAQAVEQGALNREMVEQSFNRIWHAKQQLPSSTMTLKQKLEQARTVLANDKAKAIEQELSDQAITAIKGTGQLSAEVKHLHILFPDDNKCQALNNEIARYRAEIKITCSNTMTATVAEEIVRVKQADALIVANVTPKQSVVEMGGMADLPRLLEQLKKSKRSKTDQDNFIKELLTFAKQKGKETLFISLRMPYDAIDYRAIADHIIATYSYNQYEDSMGKQTGTVYQSIAKLLTGQIQAQGQLPVTIDTQKLKENATAGH